jgi:hypothetical protein
MRPMIRSLHLQNVGPSHELKLDLAPRLNVLTGDNGLGKTFLLDVAWWLLTGIWAGESALPGAIEDRPAADGPQAGRAAPGIGGVLDARTAEPSARCEVGATFNPRDQTWTQVLTRGQDPAQPSSMMGARPSSMVVYVRHDGSFALWDALAAPGGLRGLGDAGLLFAADELWEGKQVPDVEGKRRPPLCRGLLEDWRSWQLERDPTFEWLRQTLEALSEVGEPLVPGEPARVKISDDRKIPTLSTSYGEVPVTLASAGVKRVLGVAYLLVWAWQRHAAIAKLQMRAPTPDMVVLIDEVELHLHPQWQRTILPALLKAISTFAPDTGVQIIATTHAPLVLASLEPHFQPELDALFTFDLKGRRGARRVVVEKAVWRRFGDASDWLTSHAFDLKHARSREAEVALERATAALDEPDLTREGAREIYRALRGSLGDTDPFWMEWRSIARRWGMEP